MDSAAHKRRIGRKLPKVRQLAAVGGLTIEFPYSRRPGLRTKKAWRDAVEVGGNVLFGKRTKNVRRVSGYFDRGFQDWHWFNDERPGYRPDVFNPHMNFIVDYPGALEPEQLASLKEDLREAFDCPDLIVHYGYATKPGQIYHMLRYNTRATFLKKEWDEPLAAELYGFRQSRSWGKWDDAPVWNLKEAEAAGEDISGLEFVSKLYEHVCPDCGEPLAVRDFRTKLNKKTGEREFVLNKATGLPIPVYWSKPLPSILLEASGALEVSGTELYRIPLSWFEPEPKPERVNMAELRRSNKARLKELRKKAKRENWKKYVSANLNSYVLSGGKLDED